MITKDDLFSQLKTDISHDPPILGNISKLLSQFIEGLCSFCPSKTGLNNKIKSSFPENIQPEDTQMIIYKLIYWIQQFQSPADDAITKKMLNNYKNNPSVEGIITILSEFYDHTEKVYQETCEARKRLINGENVIPPQHRKTVTGKNGIPNIMKSGK